VDNLRTMDLNPDEFEFYVAGFRHGVPPHAGWGLGVERILMKLTGAKNVRETVLFPRDLRRHSPWVRSKANVEPIVALWGEGMAISWKWYVGFLLKQFTRNQNYLHIVSAFWPTIAHEKVLSSGQQTINADSLFGLLCVINDKWP